MDVIYLWRVFFDDTLPVSALVSLSFSGALGLTFLLLGCVLEQFGYVITTLSVYNVPEDLALFFCLCLTVCVFGLFRVYWPLFVLIFYVLSPLPYFIVTRLGEDTNSSSNACRELSHFLTTGIVISAFGLPVVLARKELVR